MESDLLLKIKPISKDFTVPVKGSIGAACYDLVATQIEVVEPGFVKVMFGFSTEFDKNFKMVLQPRSGLAKTSWCIPHSFGVIDSDFRGELMTFFRLIPKTYQNQSTDFPYKVGDRVAQFSMERVLNPEIVIVDELNKTIRNDGGFNSTGN